MTLEAGAGAAEDAGAAGAKTTIERDGKACTHQVAFPDGTVVKAQPPPAVPKPARTFPFDIDPFQETAANALEAGDSVLVAAHTSAGKTVVAQYAIAMALRDKSRVIYTSPLKALSNQKYKEFAEDFADVGLMTGDVTINPEASCLVMTTEILRSMLYHGSEVVREAQLLVYDEIHYIKDKGRGVVWEESIIMLPDQCQYAFLSATIPNAHEFAQWVATTHKKKCHVVYTDFRPVPLQHYIMPCGAATPSLFCVALSVVVTNGPMLEQVDKQGTFKDSNFQKAMALASDSGSDPAAVKQQKKTDQGEDSDIYKLVRILAERNLDPVIVFALSKRQCEELAGHLKSVQLNSKDEGALVESIFWGAMDILSPEDRRLPQICNALPMLQRGIGVHHSGLLPIVKEVIEVLFGEGLIKVLFATETFSTGLNMPARTVVFAGVRKFDGATFRPLSGGEYTQMSGRAGRRGLDASGTVILMCDQRLDPAVAKGIVRGAPDPLHSAFRLTYPSLLSVSRLDVDQVTPEVLISRSLRQWQMRRALPQARQRLADARAAADAVEVPQQEDAEELLHLLQEREHIDRAMRQIEAQPQHAVPFLQPGRLVRLALPSHTASPEADADPAVVAPSAIALPPAPEAWEVPTGSTPAVWAAVLSFERLSSNNDASTSAAGAVASSAGGKVAASADEALNAAYVVDVLACVRPGGARASKSARRDLLPHDSADGVPLVVAVPLSQVVALGAPRVIMPKNILTLEARQKALGVVGESIRRLTTKFGSVPLLDAKGDLKVSASSHRKLQLKLDRLEVMIQKSSLSLLDAADRTSRLAAVLHRSRIMATVAALRRDVDQAESMILKSELAQRKRVLRRLGYLESGGTVTTKGHAAAGLSSGDCLVLTEMLFNGTLTPLTPTQLASILSCFVWSESSERGMPKVREDMQATFAALRDAAKRVAAAQEDSGMACDVDGYVNSFRPDLVDTVTLWATGSTFLQVKNHAKTIFEGSLVRALRRLHELLLQLKLACDVIGDLQLGERFEEAAARLNRDVVFAASLYL